MKKSTITTNNAPAAIGSYSQGIRAGELIFTSGQLGLDPQTGQPVEGSFSEEARQVLENLIGVIEAAGGSSDSVIKTTVYLVNLDNYQKLNRIYQNYFNPQLPARSVVEVKALPKDMNLEIEAIALLK